MARPHINRWAMFYDECVQCKSMKRKHHGNGLCSTCKNRAVREGSSTLYRDMAKARRRSAKPEGWCGIRVYDNLMGEGTTYTVEPFTIDGEPHVVVCFDSSQKPIQWKTEELRRIA